MTESHNPLYLFVAAAAFCILGLPDTEFSQDIYQPHEIRIIDPGTIIALRTNEIIYTSESDGRVFSAVVDQDVEDRKKNLVIQKGSKVELTVKRNADNKLVLDLDSITINDRRFAPQTEEVGGARIEAIVVGRGIEGAVQKRPKEMVDIPADSVMTFRLVEALRPGVTDLGYTQNGYHYHYGYDGGTSRAKPSIR